MLFYRGTFLDTFERIGTWCTSISFRIFGPFLVVGFYSIMAMHVYAFFTIATPLFKDRIGTFFGMIWIIVGLTLAYNTIFNHMLAMLIKPGGP